MQEFGKGAYSQEVAQGITRPLHATAYITYLSIISRWFVKIIRENAKKE